MQALRAARAALTVPTIPLDPRYPDAALLYELPFKLDGDLRDIATAALVLGNRWNDFREYLSREMDELAYVGDDPGRQREHFLRALDHDEGNDGAPRAIAAAREFIYRNVKWALEHGLDADGNPDGSKRTTLATYLNYSDTVNVQLPVFYTYVGHALHTLQDSFSHALRSPDGLRITSPMNSLESTQGDFDERRDGPHEPKAMDACEGLDDRRDLLWGLARQSSKDLLEALLTPGPVEARLKAANAVLDRYLGYEPGCSYDNRWCDAPENAYRDPRGGCACEAASGGLAEGWPVLAVLLFFLVGARRASVVPRVLGVVVTLALPSSARGEAQSVPASSRPAPACAPGRQLRCDCAEGKPGYQICERDGQGFGPCACPQREVAGPRSPRKPLFGETSRFGMEATLGASIDKTAFAFSSALRVRLHEKWLVGLGLEWNPWASFDVMEVNRGVLNIYATAIRRFPIGQRYALRTTAHFGLSYLLLDLVAAQKGSVGLYFRVNFIGLEYRMTRLLRLVIDPADVVLAVPQITGTPLTYIQYRFSLGLQIGG